MAATEPTLARGAIGLREVLFQSVTSMAPAGAVALSIAAGASYAGGALLSYPSSETGLAIGIWYIIGIVVLVYLYLRHPARLPEMRRVFADEEPPAAAGEPVTSGEAA
jgi:hypothetical protein